METLEELISSLEYSYGADLDSNFITEILMKYNNLILDENTFNANELISIHYLIGLCNDLLFNTKESLQSFNLCLDYSLKTQCNTYISKCYLYTAKLYFQLYDLDNYKSSFDIAEKLLIDDNNYSDLSKLYTDIIFCKVKIDYSTDEILNLLSKTLTTLTLFENKFSPQIYMRIGSLYSIYLKDNYYAIELYKKGLSLANKYKLTDVKVMITYFIGVGYLDLNRNIEACKIFENLLLNEHEIPTIKMKCIFSLELLNIYIDTKSNIDYIDPLIGFIEKNLILLGNIESIQFKSQLLLIKCRLGLLLKDTSFDVLIDWITESKEIYTTYKSSYKFSHMDCTVESIIGDIYYEFEYYTEALSSHKLALKFSSIYEVKYMISAHKSIAKDYAALNNYEQAFIHMEKVDNMRSTIQHVNLLDNYTKVYKEFEHLKEHEETKSQFFANLSHELKTPINIIYSSIQLLSLLKSNNDDTFKKYYVKHEKSVNQNCLRILKLIDNLIDTTKIDSGSFNLNFANFNIVKLIEDITLSTLPYVEIKKLTLTFDTEIEELDIQCDPYAIERIMLNLLSNAIKFTYEGGSINVLISLKGNNVCIKVNDDGIGIAPSMKEKIFEKFIQIDSSLNRKKEGSGIGLSLVKSLVELHNGRVNLNTDRMRGSEFIVLLPNIKCTTDTNTSIVNNYFSNSEKISAEFSDIYELNY